MRPPSFLAQLLLGVILTTAALGIVALAVNVPAVGVALIVVLWVVVGLIYRRNAPRP